MRAGEPAARRRLRPALSTIICEHSVDGAQCGHLGQRHDVRGIDQQRAILELEVSKLFVDVRVVAQAIAARGTKHHDVAGDRLAGREQHAHGPARRHVVAGIELRLDHLRRQRDFQHMGAIDEHRLGAGFEREESRFEIHHVADALGAGVQMAGTGKEKDAGERRRQ